MLAPEPDHAEVINVSTDLGTILDEVIDVPMDLGTILHRLLDGGFQTASEVHREVTRVWSNCAQFNGQESEITKVAVRLCKYFDKAYKDRVSAPGHMGMKEFPHGKAWIGLQTLTYWEMDHAWYSGKIVGYRCEEGEHAYELMYDDGEKEWMKLPIHEVAIIDNWEGITQPTEPWEGADERGGRRPQRSRQAVKPFNPSMGPSHGEGRAKRAKVEDATNSSILAEVEEEDIPEAPHRPAPHIHQAAPAFAAGGAGGEFLCDDGKPCGQVCRCKLLFWCRFSVRRRP
ncbi:hypothetical protein T484DRAFT_1901949 [Baffinella frigidus]|nr:hypothetical protein T484DRAFT_1901949 [Cryptophyta sp. CCMP2293]